MITKLFHLLIFLSLAESLYAQQQPELNKTDQQGRKQGYWVKKYPNGNIMYEGTFRDDKPVGEFKRYDPDKSLKSVLVYSTDSRHADATIYHPNGFVASKGKYVDQMKEGKWQFFSSVIRDYLLSEEYYSGNKRNGQSITYYPDSTIAEKVNYVNNVREGEWLRYHMGGKLLMRAYYVHGKLNGKFESWYPNGKPEYSGAYKMDMREGTWKVFTDKGTLKYEISYVNGVTKDRHADEEIESFFSKIDRTGKIADPEKSVDFRK